MPLTVSPFLYAGVGKLFNNWVKAAEFAVKNNMVPIQLTDVGKILNEANDQRWKEYEEKDYKRVWWRASVKYCINIKGSVKTFVCGANDESTFRRKEIHALMRTKDITDINGRPHGEYLDLYRATLSRLRKQNDSLLESEKLSGKERHRRAINAVFISIATNEIIDDVAHAQTSKERDAVLSRFDHLIIQQEKEADAKKATKSWFNTTANDNADMDETDEAIEEMLMANPHLAKYVAPMRVHNPYIQ